MKMFINLAATLAALTLCVSPAIAQDKKISALPAATTLTGSEKLSAVQGAGCATSTAPCANVVVTPSQISTYIDAYPKTGGLITGSVSMFGSPFVMQNNGTGAAQLTLTRAGSGNIQRISNRYRGASNGFGDATGYLKVAQNDIIASDEYRAGHTDASASTVTCGITKVTVIEPTPGSAAMGVEYAIELCPLGSATRSTALKVTPAVTTVSGKLSLGSVPTYADNAAAIAAGLVAGDVYRTSTGVLMVRH